MGLLGKPAGIFDLHDSNINVGSYIMRKDVKEILNITEEKLNAIKFTSIEGKEVIDEFELMKFFYENDHDKKVSMDEMILRAIISIAYPNSEVIAQEKVGRYSMDLKVTVNNVTKFIEFDGPSHFAQGRYGIPKNHPFHKKQVVEDKTGIEVVNWPFWIQRCTNNVKNIFENNKYTGFGALWSTNCHFGDFYFDDSAEIIIRMSERFNAWTEQSACNFYELNSLGRIKPEHPILEKIRCGKERKERLLPKGYKNLAEWIPDNIID